MRTTVTLDADVERMLKNAMHRRRRSFKQTLNEAIRSGLAGGAQPKARPFTVKARPLGLRAGIDPAGMGRLLDDLEAETFAARAARGPLT